MKLWLIICLAIVAFIIGFIIKIIYNIKQIQKIDLSDLDWLDTIMEEDLFI